MRCNLGHHLVEVVEVLYAGPPAPGPAVAAEAVRQFADRVAVEVKERDTRTSGAHSFRQIRAEAASSTGDCDGPVCEVVFHRMSPGGRVAAVLRAFANNAWCSSFRRSHCPFTSVGEESSRGSVRPPSNRVC